MELDRVFWRPGLTETPRGQWVEVQRGLIEGSESIMDGDFGPYDAIKVRLRAADTIIFLDFAFVRCAWRAIRRSRERLDFWLWLFRYRSQSRPFLIKAMRTDAPAAAIRVLRNPQAVRLFVVDVARRHPARQLLPVD